MRWSTRVVLAAACAVTASLGPAAASQAAGGLNGLDCNGFGLGAPATPPANYMCTDIATGIGPGDAGAEDNGHYIGHDEPATGFYSTVPGSGNAVQYQVTLPVEPPTPPDGSRSGSIPTFMLGPAFWFGMVLCDNQSYPEGTTSCPRDSDSNIQIPFSATHAGTAFLEMQFYPPGWPPFSQISCDMTHWCASLHINSLQGTFGFQNINPNCEETTAFAFLTKSGQPIGPAGPDDFTAASFTPTPDVLRMNPGDKLQVTIHDTPNGVFTGIKDLTTGTSGSMVASAGRGFRHIIWDPTGHTCHGAPYSYHPMYSTSQPIRPDGIAPTTTGWAAHTINVGASWEIGHFEKPDESQPNREEGPCFSGPTIPGCMGEDVEFDGYAYKTGIWPDGASKHATPFEWTSPRFKGDGTSGYSGTFPQTILESNIAQLSFLFGFGCDRVTGVGCVVPPVGVQFYPFPHTQPFSSSRGCGWSIGADLPDQISNFGGVSSAWGPPLFVNYGNKTVADNFGQVVDNPCP
jgi:hypothetical protein